MNEFSKFYDDMVRLGFSIKIKRDGGVIAKRIRSTYEGLSANYSKFQHELIQEGSTVYIVRICDRAIVDVLKG